MSNLRNFIEKSDKDIFLCTVPNGQKNNIEVDCIYYPELNTLQKIAYKCAENHDIDQESLEMLNCMDPGDVIEFYIHYDTDRKASSAYLVIADDENEAIEICRKHSEYSDSENIFYIGLPDFPTEKAEIILNRIAPAITPEILAYSLYTINKEAKQKRDERHVIKMILFDDDSIVPYLPDNFDLIDSGENYNLSNIYCMNEDLNKRLKSIPDMDLDENEKESYKEKILKMLEMLSDTESELHNQLSDLKTDIDFIYEIKNHIIEIFGTPTNKYTNFGSYGSSYSNQSESDYETDEVDDSNGGFTADDFICRIFKIHNYEFHNPVWDHDEIIDNPNANVDIADEDIEANFSPNSELESKKLTKDDFVKLIEKAAAIGL